MVEPGAECVRSMSLDIAQNHLFVGSRAVDLVAS